MTFNYTDIPGHCCPTYTCDDCTTDELTDGKCACADEAFFNKAGKCKCVDKYKSVKNSKCVCDPNLCELPRLCDENSVGVQQQNGCCVNIKCIKCPEDSYSYPIHTLPIDEIESKCVCSPCSEITCDEDTVPIITRKGNSFPGTCCDEYECHVMKVNGTCNQNGTTYQNGQTWSINEHNYKCQNGISLYSPSISYKSCQADDGTIFPHEAKWDEDNCTSCTCIDGHRKCISHMCDIEISFSAKPTDCPPMNWCLKNCKDGFVTKNACEICQCNLPVIALPPKYEKLETVMQEHNYSEEFILELLKRYNETTTKSTTSIPIITTTTTTTSTISDSGMSPTNAVCLTGKLNLYHFLIFIGIK